MVAAFLDESGYEARMAANGQEGLEILAAWRPDLVILDMMMPVLDGRGFRSALLATPELSEIPIVVYSAVSGLEELPGIVGHVRKGFDNPDVLLGFLEAACARSQQNQSRRSRP